MGISKAGRFLRSLLFSIKDTNIAFILALLLLAPILTASSSYTLSAPYSYYANKAPFDQQHSNSTPEWVMKALNPPRPEPHVDPDYALYETQIIVGMSVNSAEQLFERAKGKASDGVIRQLAVAKNKTTTAILLGTIDEMSKARAELKEVEILVQAEITAWEIEEARKAAEAEAARIAAEAEAARKQIKSSSSGAKGSSKSSGSYTTSEGKAYLEGIASSYGVTISWSDNYCGRVAKPGHVSGCYSGGSFVTVTHSAYSSYKDAHGRGRNVVIHEIAHVLTQWQCGTVRVGGDRFENVNDAVTVLLGGGQTGYGYTDADMEIAEAIRAGQCPG